MSSTQARPFSLQGGKQALLEALLRDEGLRPPPSQIPRRTSSGPAPTSLVQQRMWFVHRLQPESPAYNIPTAVRLRGSLKVQLLRESLEEIVRRHETLRTQFPASDEGPLQRVAPSVELRWTERDLQTLPPESREERVSQILEREAAIPFQLSTGPLVSVLLLQLEPEHYVLLLNLAHIIADAWSVELLFTELSTLYRARCAGTEPSLASLDIQYSDYATWQQQWVTSHSANDHFDYWLRQLAGTLPKLELATDRPRRPAGMHSGAWLTRHLNPALAEALKALAQAENCTLFMVLLAGFQTLLFRYTGQKDVLVGSPVTQRNHLELESLIGCFVNTVVLRTPLDGQLAFRQLLARVREVVTGALAHQELPFEHLVAKLQPERDPSQNPLFQVAFVLQGSAVGRNWKNSLQLPNVTTDVWLVPTHAAKFDLTLQMEEESHGLAALFEYRTDLFDASTIERMLEHLENLLQAAVADPDTPLARLTILGEAERQRVVSEWNATATDYPRDARVDQLFSEQTLCAPDRVAVRLGDRSWTYGELEAASNRLAHWLRSKQVGDETPIAVALERSWEFIVAVVGVLKSGGVYVPLDPQLPASRVQLLLDDLGIRHVLANRNRTSESFLPRAFEGETGEHFSPARDLEVFWFDAPTEEYEKSPATPVARVGNGDSACYVMYTSGSTGTPKGVVATHRGVVRLVRETNYLPFSADSVFLQYAPSAFDASTLEIWGPLLHGGIVVIPPPGQLSLSALGKIIREQNVTTLWLTAGLFQSMVDENLEDLAGVRYLLAGGDTLSKAHVQTALQALPGTVLINGYGPTENTTFTCCHSLQPGTRLRPGSVPIGRPINNTRVYLLDEWLQPVPIGVPGELYTAGDGLARGYWNRPDLTAEKFISVPLDGRDQRLYRTGDRARWLADGTIEFLGRFDNQVKLRGYRIELGEIDAALAKHPEVREAHALVRETPRGDKQLLAFVVRRSGSQLEGPALKGWLQQQLPSYMVPAAITAIDCLPLTVNGKIDQRALLQITASLQDHLQQSSRRAVETCSGTERQLLAIWEELLGMPVDPEDNFFDLGGHSLLAVRLVAHIEKRLGKVFPLAAFFQAPTVRSMAELLEGNSSTPPSESLIVIQDAAARPPLLFLPLKDGYPFYLRAMAKYLGPEWPVYVLQPVGMDGRCAPCETLEEMASLLADQVLNAQPQGPYYLCGWSFAGALAYEVARQMHARGHEVDKLVIFDTILPGGARLRPWRRRLTGRAQRLLKLSWRARREYFLSQARNLTHRVRGLLRKSSKADSAVQQVMQTVEAASLKALETYRPQRYPGNMILLQAEDLTMLDNRYDIEPLNGWQKLVEQEIDVYRVSCCHHQMFDEPYVQEVAQQFLRALLAPPAPKSSVHLASTGETLPYPTVLVRRKAAG